MSEWKTIKIKKDTYDTIKRMGVGIGKAVELMAKYQAESVEKKIENIRSEAESIADLLSSHGVFDIKFLNSKISEIEEVGDILNLKVVISLLIPNEEVRSSFKEILKVGK